MGTAKNRRPNRANILHRKLIGCCLLLVVLAIVPLVVHSPYYMNVVITAGINAILAMTFILVLRTGLINLAIAAFSALGAYASAMLVMRLGLSFWLALPASVIIVGIIAICIGYLFVKFTGFSFIILTAVMGMLVVVAFGNIPFLGGYSGILGIPPPNPIPIPLLGPIEFVTKAPYYYLMLFLVILVALLLSAFYASSTGRAWKAIGLNPRLAESVGVNVFRYRLMAFVIASAVAGLAGSFQAHYIGVIVPESFDIYKTIYVQIYAILGGVDFAILGPLTGALIMTFVPELLRSIKEYEPIITGLIIVLLLLFLPGGLLSLLGFRRLHINPHENISRLAKVTKSLLPSNWRR